MFIRNLVVFSLVLLKFHNYSGCDDAPKKNEQPATTSASTKSNDSPPGYDLSKPGKIELGKELSEISGIAYYPKDSSIFAIVDEDGLLYKISLGQNHKIAYWRFDKKHDYEDMVLHDSTFYILISNGNILKFRFSKDSLSKTLTRLPSEGNKINDFETLYYDDHYGKLVMLCKECEDDQKKTVSSYGISVDSLTYTPGIVKINIDPLLEKLKVDKLHLKPSAAAINPVTKDLYILASENKLLVITNRQGVLKDVYQLDPTLFNQSEGLAFTPSGDMIISNEAGENNANILIFKYQKEE